MRSSMTPALANVPGSLIGRNSCAKRHPTQRNAVAVAHSGARSTWSNTPLRSAAAVHTSGSRDWPFLPRIAFSRGTVARERLEALVAMLRPGVGLEEPAGEREAVTFAAAVRIDDPARELFESRFEFQLLQLVELEQALVCTERGVFLHEQRRA